MSRFLAPAAVVLILFTIYTWTMAPGTFWIDSAAFATCNAILGMPHSPSFPLYTLLGRAVTVLLPVSAAMASNIYSTVVSVIGGVLFYGILILLMRPIAGMESRRQLAAATGTVFAFLTIPIWQSAGRAEVYALQTTLSLAVVYSFLRSVGDADDSRRIRFALAAIFFQSLAFANHSLLALATVPLIVATPFYLGWQKIKAKFFGLLVGSTIIFAIGLSPYLYLPLRASQNPAVNSGQPKTIALAAKAITRSGEDYYPEMPAVAPNYAHRAFKQMQFLFEQTTGLILLALIGGIYIAFRERFRPFFLLWLVIVLGFAISVWAVDFLMVNFDIVAYTSLTVLLIIAGAFFVLYRLMVQFRNRPIILTAAPIILMLLALSQFSINLYACDLTGTKGPDRLAQQLLERSPQNAMLVVDDDNVILPLWFYCHALKERPDLRLVLSGALYRPSYRGELRDLYPDLHYPEVFKNYKIDDIGSAIHQLCSLNAAERPILVQYGSPGVEADMLIPDGLLFRYRESLGADRMIAIDPTTTMLDSLIIGSTDLLSKDFVGRMAFNYGVYFEKARRPAMALECFQYAVDTDVNPDYLLRLGVAALGTGHEEEAVKLLQEALNTGDGSPNAEKILTMIAEKKVTQP